jgi:CheY-like chemotaxis protein/anti-sigma regulatory factor (Ser/Thr protein kinase)
VLGDPHRLQQVVWNLLSNAVKFTARGGKVRVMVGRDDGSAVISVRDTGEGIGPEFLPYVFDRFRQADASTTRKHGGLGLGLSIVKHLMEMHGGAVQVASEGVGRGATFSVTLPLSTLRPVLELPAKGAELETECPPAIGGVHVLLVEDEPDVRELVVAVLERCGVRVTIASSVAEALEALRRDKPDLLLSDIGLPGEDGYSLIRKVRALPPHEGGRIPAVAMTAYARLEDRTRALLAGFQLHVPKPVAPEELLAVVAALSGKTQPAPS